MALTSVTVTKKSVRQVMEGQYSVTLELKGFDGILEIFSREFSEDYKTGDLPSRIEDGFVEQMQDYIDQYNNEQAILNHSLMDTSVGNIEAALEV